MKPLGIFGTLSAVALIALPVLAADVTGRWKAEFETQIGLQKYTYDLKAAGAALTGTATVEVMGENRTSEIKEGKITGDQVAFVETIDFQGTPLRIEYSGQLVGDELKLTRKVGDFATEELVAKRVKP